MMTMFKTKPVDRKFVVVGDGAVGKSTLLWRYITGRFMRSYMPTLFEKNIVSLIFKDQQFTVSLIDTAGQVTYDRVRTLSYCETDMFIVCFSVSSRESFDSVSHRWVPEIKMYNPSASFVLVGMQTDLRDGREPAEWRGAVRSDCVSRREGIKGAKRLGARSYVECSALTGQNVDLVLQEALRQKESPVRENNIRNLWRRLPWIK